jgi:hypothetical protein
MSEGTDNTRAMSTTPDFCWPAPSDGGLTEVTREQWNEQAKRLFCKDEDDMLVECGSILADRKILTLEEC